MSKEIGNSSTVSGKETTTKNAEQNISDEDTPLIPIIPKKPILIAKNMSTGKYLLPEITKEDSWNARLFLKHFGVRSFLDKYLPNELNSLYLYFLIKLLGFESKDRLLIKLIEKCTEKQASRRSKYTYTNIDDPLAKNHTVRLIKDLQKAMNKILATRIRLPNFFTIDHFVQKLLTAKNIIVLTGAGVSTSLGIPDFRSSEGFYSRIKHLGLDDPQDVFNLEIFTKNPSIFYSIANMVLPPEHIYSPLHSFIKMLYDKGKLLRNYTQNIDNLESYAGIPPSKLVQCHGSFATASCVTCHWKLPGEKIFQNIRNVELPLCPYCYPKRKQLMEALAKRKEERQNQMGNDGNANINSNSNSSQETSAQQTKEQSNNKNTDHEDPQDELSVLLGPEDDEETINSYGVLKPDITFFGEALPTKFHKALREDIIKCDLLICIGTSLKVAPVSEIVNMIPVSAPQVLINMAPVKHAAFDLSLLGFCDDVATLVTEKCGWEIPHPKWKSFKNKSFEVVRKDRGVFNITASNQ